MNPTNARSAVIHPRFRSDNADDRDESSILIPSRNLDWGNNEATVLA